MDKYEVLGQVGEGSFGQVYKARKRCNGEIVAFKVIRKRGRSLKELKSLRQECEIQRRLHHPNIVRMLDSFETDNEIVVVIEYADKELYELLGKAGRLSEERAQVIACDLVSALYYLHSNRVLHRDLKPQNILLEANGVAKVCDFGFARNMSTRTHVLTSMKGTPLYMAPELIEGCPYDHNADLWSLGCIIYELIVGTPPFQTTNILHLAILLRFKAVKWPDFISHNCKTFLQGLLQKEPSKRLTWPELLDHPFVKDRILKVGETAGTPFTAPLSASQAWAKQKQFESLVMCSENQFKVLEKAVLKIQEQERKLRSQRYNRTCVSQPRMSAFGHCPLGQPYHALHHSEPSGTDSSASVDVLLGNLSLRASLRSDLIAAEHAIRENENPDGKTIRPIDRHVENENFGESDRRSQSMNCDARVSPFARISENSENPEIRGNARGDEGTVVATLEKSPTSRLAPESGDCERASRLSIDYEREFGNDDVDCEKQIGLADWDPSIVERHIENEEWVAFLQRSMEELMDGEIDSVLQENCVSVFVSPLRNSAAGCRVVEYVACLLSLPFSMKISRNNVEDIERVYLDVRVVPNLVYAMKRLMFERTDDAETRIVVRNDGNEKSATELSADELQALECSMLLLCRLIHAREQFLTQFCDAVYIVNGITFLRELLTLEKRKSRIVADLIAILNNILRSQPENAELVEKIVLRAKSSTEIVETFFKLLNHRQNVIRGRTCTLIRLLGRFCCRALQRVWGKRLRNLIENLVIDDDETVRNAAEGATSELKQLMYYDQDDPRE